MSAYEQQKLVEVVLCILNKTSGVDIYPLFKIMYFAEREHLATYGRSITADEYHALPYGPVPTHLYNAVKAKGKGAHDLARLLWKAVDVAGDDAPNVLLPKRAVDACYISASDEGALNKSVDENARQLFGDLKNLSHDEAYEIASKKRRKVILPPDMAKAAGATSATVEYIQEQQELDRWLA
jgi:hypothetical protein